MIRPLLITFAAASVIAIAAGIGLAMTHPQDLEPKAKKAPGPVETRDFAWPGASSLAIWVPAEITYIQGPAAKVTATGAAGTLGELEISNGEIRLKGGCNVSWAFEFGSDKENTRRFKRDCDALADGAPPLKITVTGPNTEKFDLNGAGTLAIENYDRPSLKVDISGAGKATAVGKTDKLDMDLSGATDADFSNLAVKDATIDISGVGHAKIKATGEVSVDISGAGDVDLLTRPAKLTQDISGAGHINQP